jgi:HK97 family phage prohead protease
MKRKQQPDAMERRSFPLQIRAASEEGAESPSPKLSGYAAVFGSETELFPGVFEMIDPGAFDKTLAENDIRAVWNHNTDIVLGRTKNKTLALSADKRGLHTEIDPPSTDLVRDMCVAPILRGDVDQMSFGFNVLREKWEERADGTLLITLIEARLWEVSPCTIPAYPDTQISARSMERIEEFRQRRQAAEVQSAPGQTAHPEHTEAGDPTPTQGHPEQSAPADLRHLDDDLNLRLDLAKRKHRLIAA